MSGRGTSESPDTAPPALTGDEQRLLDAFRKLDEKRKGRLVEDAEDMLLAMSKRIDSI